MDPHACAETAVEIWITINDKLIARRQEEISTEERIAVYENAVDIYQTGLINEAKNRNYGGHDSSTQKETHGKPLSDAVCRDCGRTLTVGEKKYCDDTKSPYLCYKCSHN